MIPAVLTAGIFLLALLSFLLMGFNALLSAKIAPIKADLKRLEERVDGLENILKQVLERLPPKA